MASKVETKTPLRVFRVGLFAGLLSLIIAASPADASAQVFNLDRIPTMSEIPFAFVGTWDWRTPRQSCGSRTDSYGGPLVFGEGQGGVGGRPICQWPTDELEALLNGRGRAWLEFSEGDEALSPKWTCGAASLGTVLTEGYLRTFSTRADALVMHYEQSNWWRWIWTDGRKHPPATESYSHGHSLGWMDGNTFVVETTNFTWDPDGYDDQSHIARSHMARYTERYTLTGTDTMELEITVEDPLFLTAPFVFTGMLEKTDQEPINSWDCDPETGVRELYQTSNNPYPDDPTPDLYNAQ
jgi:hypothetical protein